MKDNIKDTRRKPESLKLSESNEQLSHHKERRQPTGRFRGNNPRDAAPYMWAQCAASQMAANLGAAKFAVYMGLVTIASSRQAARKVNEDGWFHAGREEIGGACGMSGRCVTDHIWALHEARLIDVKEPQKKGRGHALGFRLLLIGQGNAEESRKRIPSSEPEKGRKSRNNFPSIYNNNRIGKSTAHGAASISGNKVPCTAAAHPFLESDGPKPDFISPEDARRILNNVATGKEGLQ